jgi:hypothetical protein
MVDLIGLLSDKIKKWNDRGLLKQLQSSQQALSRPLSPD